MTNHAAVVEPLRLPCSLGPTTLRTFQHGDVADFAAYRSDVDLAEFQGWLPLDLDGAKAFVASMSHVTRLVAGDWIQLAIADTTSHRLVGDVGMFLASDLSHVELGFTVAREHQRLGHATRAIALAIEQAYVSPSVVQVRAIVDARNTASIATLARAGFTRCDERHVSFKGEMCTEYLYVSRTGARRATDTASVGNAPDR